MSHRSKNIYLVICRKMFADTDISVKREIVTHLKQTNKKEIKLKLNLKSAKCVLKFIYKKTDKVRNSVQHSAWDEC